MGQCADQMKPQTDNGKSVHRKFGKDATPPTAKGKGKDKDGDVEKAMTDKGSGTLFDNFAEAHTTLTKLIAVKERELQTEKGDEAYNEVAYSKLKHMNYHLEQLLTIQAGYGRSN